MKIMEIVSGWGVNGAIVTCLETIRALVDRGHDVTLVCRPKAWIGDQLEGSGVEVIRSDMHRWPADELRRIHAYIRSNNVDVIHTHMSRANFFGVILRRFFGVPCVATANNRYIQLHWMFNDRVIAASQATKKFHHRFNLVPNRRIDVIHNFVDFKKYDGLDSKLRHEKRAEFGFDDQAIVIGQIGDVISRKGLIYAVRALPDVLAANDKAKLLVVGFEDPNYVASVTEEASRLGVLDAITFAGLREDIDAILSAIDVFVLPTLEDNLPLAILESMSSRLPVVATRVGGIPECVVDQETGFLVPPAKAKPLAESLAKLVSDLDLRTAMGEAGFQRASTEFSPERKIEQLESVLMQTAKSQHRNAAG